MVEVKHPENPDLTYLVVFSESNLDIFCMNTGGQGTPSMTHLKKAKVSMDCLCASSSDAGKFYIANQNKIALAMVDLNSPQYLTFCKTKF